MYVYTLVDVTALYSDSDFFKRVCDFVLSLFDSTQISFDASNFYKELVANSIIIKYYFLIFL